MKRTHLLLIGMILAAAVAVIWSTSHAQGPVRVPAPPPARVAVCDVGMLFNGYTRRNELNALFDQKRKKANEADKAKLAELKTLQSVLDSLKANAPGYGQKLAQFEKLTLERQLWRQLLEQKFTREHRLLMQELYAEVLGAVKAVAQAKRYDLVIYKDSVEITSQSTSELLSKIAQTKCLYANPAIDLTTPVLELLNRNHAARK